MRLTDKPESRRTRIRDRRRILPERIRKLLLPS